MSGGVAFHMNLVRIGWILICEKWLAIGAMRVVFVSVTSEGGFYLFCPIIQTYLLVPPSS